MIKSLIYKLHKYSETPRHMNENTNPKYCVVINGGDTSSSSSSSSHPPPPQPTSITTIIPRNENSQRVFSKRFRVFIFREFLLRTYSVLLNGVSGGQGKKPPTVLDVAGGAGTLSWILYNVDNINSIIVDPKTPNHRRLVKSVEFLLDHPEECAVRSTEGVPTHQPLAKLIPSLVHTNCSSSSDGNGNERNKMMIFQPTSPSYMRIRVDSTLVDILRKVITDAAAQTSSITSEDDDGADNDSNNLLLWDEYWKKASIVVMKSNVVYKTSSNESSVNDNCQILHSRHALEVFQSLDLLVGFHP